MKKSTENYLIEIIFVQILFKNKTKERKNKQNCIYYDAN